MIQNVSDFAQENNYSSVGLHTRIVASNGQLRKNIFLFKRPVLKQNLRYLGRERLLWWSVFPKWRTLFSNGKNAIDILISLSTHELLKINWKIKIDIWIVESSRSLVFTASTSISAMCFPRTFHPIFFHFLICHVAYHSKYLLTFLLIMARLYNFRFKKYYKQILSQQSHGVKSSKNGQR